MSFSAEAYPVLGLPMQSEAQGRSGRDMFLASSHSVCLIFSFFPLQSPVSGAQAPKLKLGGEQRELEPSA